MDNNGCKRHDTDNNINKYTYIKRQLKNVLSVTKIVTMYYLELDKDFTYEGEVHDFWEMVYVDSGSIVATASKESYTLKKGDYIFHKPNEFHTLTADHKSPANVFIISFVSTSSNMRYFRNKIGTLPSVLSSYIEILLKEGKETFEWPLVDDLMFNSNPPFGSQQIIRTTLEQLLIMLIRAQLDSPKNIHLSPINEKPNIPIVDSVIKLLYENIYGQINVEYICKKLNYSKTYISKVFLKNCGCTIMEYYTSLKIKEAKLLMRNNMYNISEISDMLGFNTPHYFSRVFKRVTNMTPRDYCNSISE